MIRRMALALIMLLSVVFIDPSAAMAETDGSLLKKAKEDGVYDRSTFGDYSYRIIDDVAVEIMEYSGDEREVDIPEEIDGLPVFAIAESGFRGNGSIEKVHIPESIIYIGALAFCGCKNLSEVDMTHALEEVGEGALEGTRPYYLYDTEGLYYRTFENAQDISEIESWRFLKGKKIIPLLNWHLLDGSLYFLMPNEARTYDLDEADYSIVRHEVEEARRDYNGPAHNTITEVYLCGRDGTIIFIGSVTNEPPKAGLVRKGVSLGGREATAMQMWDIIKSIFVDHTMEDLLDAFDNRLYRATYDALLSGTTIQKGSRGESARGIQQTLKDFGKSISVDGSVGAKTIAVLNEVQREYGLEITDSVDAGGYAELLKQLLIRTDPDKAAALLDP